MPGMPSLSDPADVYHLTMEITGILWDARYGTATIFDEPTLTRFQSALEERGFEAQPNGETYRNPSTEQEVKIIYLGPN